MLHPEVTLDRRRQCYCWRVLVDLLCICFYDSILQFDLSFDISRFLKIGSQLCNCSHPGRKYLERSILAGVSDGTP